MTCEFCDRRKTRARKYSCLSALMDGSLPVDKRFVLYSAPEGSEMEKVRQALYQACYQRGFKAQILISGRRLKIIFKEYKK